MENATDNRHGYYNFHTEDYSQTAVRFTGQSYYFTVVHTTDKLLEQLQLDLKEKNRETSWYSRKDMDKQFQIKVERVGREGQSKTNMIGQYLEIKVTYKQTLKNIIEDKTEYKQTHFHDYSVITTNTYLNEEYMKKMIAEIYQQSEAKRDAPPPYTHTDNSCSYSTTLLDESSITTSSDRSTMQPGPSYFDENGHKYFMKLERLRPQPLPQEATQYQDDITEGEDEDIFDEYDETRSTTRASASSSNIAHIEKQHSLKRKITGEARGTPQKKQGDVITNFYNIKIGNYHAASSSSLHRQLPTNERELRGQQKTTLRQRHQGRL
eukprot:5995758-Amphidinium_carterae.1